MSYASIASHNIPAGEMPQPDQDLLDGHFDGETPEHVDADAKVSVLPAGADPHHPDLPEIEPTAPISINLHPAAEPEPHVSEVAPEPLPTPNKHKVDLPESGAEFEKHAKEEAKKVEKKAEKVEKKAEVKAKEVEKDVKETADKVGKDVKETADKVGKNVKETADKVGTEAKATADKIGKEAKVTANKVEKEVKATANKVEKEVKEGAKELKKKGNELSKKAQEELEYAESKLAPYWEKTKDVVLRPGTLGGLMGVVNVGILGTAGYFAYTRQHQPWDRRLVGGVVAGTLALFGAEGYVADSYLSTPEGKQEAQRAKAEGSKFYLQSKEVILRPGVAGGLAGAVNVAIIGVVGYFSYKNWNQPWDSRTVSAISVGLIGLSGLEGWAGKAYVDNELPKH